MAASPPGGSGLPPGLLPPTFPQGVDPTTYKIAEVTELLKAAAYFPIFNVPDPAVRPDPVYLFPSLRDIPVLNQLWIAVRVHEQLHRFEVIVEPPIEGRGLTAINRFGEPVALVHIRFTPIPEDFQAAPNVLPPVPQVLNPYRSQRVCMLDGQLDFQDAAHSGIRAFGCGRTFPGVVGGQPVLYLGAVIDVLEGLGELAGLPGATFPGATMVINGYIQPQQGNLRLNLLIRIMDPRGKLTATGPLRPLQPIPDPDPSAVFMYFLGEPDPSHPVELITGSDGLPVGSRVFEKLRLIRIDFNIGASQGLRSVSEEGPVVGTVSAVLHFSPLNPQPVQPIQTTDGVFTFSDLEGRQLGTVQANMVEGRAFRTNLPGAPLPVFRFGGFGPILDGTGEFANAVGMMSMNSAISVFPRTLSNLYVLRFEDPAGSLRARLAGSGLVQMD
ncbi:MAG: hypothetical protein ABUT39_08445 [Acidobacteriota bacterium]